LERKGVAEPARASAANSESVRDDEAEAGAGDDQAAEPNSKPPIWRGLF